MSDLRAMADWMKGPGAGARASLNTVGDGVDGMNSAADAQNVDRLQSACQSITDPLTIELPTSLPTPDPDLTNAFEVLSRNGEVLASACEGMADPPTDDQLDALQDAMGTLGTNLKTTGSMLKRDGQLMMNAS